MGSKRRAEMNLQYVETEEKNSATDGIDEPPSSGKPNTQLKCSLVPDRIPRSKEELPNPRRLAKLRLGDAIDGRNRDAAAVVQALIDVGVTHVGDLLDVNVKELFAGLKISQEQLNQFVISIENAGVRFTRTN